MNNELQFALNSLPPQGLALKRHILDKLLTAFPKPLTIAEVSHGGPSRTYASISGALKSLDRIGATRLIPAEKAGDVIRCELAPKAHDTVREFLRQPAEKPHPVSSLPPRRAYQQVLRAMYESPKESFTVKSLPDKVWSERTSLRTPLTELFKAGYLLRDVGPGHGRPEFVYRLNPDARDHADALLCAPTCSPTRRS